MEFPYQYYAYRWVEFIDSIGDVTANSSHRIWLRAKLPDAAAYPNEYEFQAYIGPERSAAFSAGEPRRLKWTVNGAVTDTLTLNFDPSATGCGPDPSNLSSVGILTVNSIVAPDITLEISSDQLLADNTAYVNGVDVSLEVDTGQLCKHNGLHTEFFFVTDETFDQVTGYGSGTYIGRSAPAIQGVPDDTAMVYQQLPKNDTPPPTWRGANQQWAVSQQWEYWDGWKSDPTRPTSGTDADLMKWHLGTKWGGYPNFPALSLDLTGQPTQADPGACRDYYPAVTTHVSAVDTVAILVDRSGSMAETWNNALEESKSRYAWATAGAVGFAAAGQTAAIPMSVSMATFNDSIQAHSDSGLLDPAGSGVFGLVSASEINYALDLKFPTGSTAIADAVVYAILNMLTDQSANNAVFLLTDGQNNTGASIESASFLSNLAKVPVYVSPIGEYNVDDTNIDALANVAGGQVMDVLSPDEIPAMMFELRATLRGDDASLLYKKSSLFENSGPASYNVLVEPGADRLLVLVTPQDASKTNWEPDFTLSGPLGEVITELDLAMITENDDGFFQLISVPSPSTGEWTMTLNPPPNSGHPPRHQIVMAHVEHESYDAPRCDVHNLSGTITDNANAVEIVAEADWMGLVGEGATFSGEVRRPDGTLSNFVLTQQPDGTAKGSFDAYSHDGFYQVRVTCRADADASYAPGETQEPADQLEAAGIPGAFERVGTAFFLVDAGLNLYGEGNTCSPTAYDRDGDGNPDLCDADDDGDGLPDAMEGVGDTDSDGVNNNGDHDSDNDGEGDGRDWDPTDPTSYRRYSVGDFNGDGSEDLVRGEPTGNASRGQVTIKMAGESVDEVWSQNSSGILEVSETGDNFGEAIVVGDFDGDGYDDLAVGAPDEHYGALSDAGAVNVLYGSSTGITAVGDQLWKESYDGVKGAAESGDRFGSRLSVGDFNCDGFDDLVIGTPDEAIGANIAAGAVHVIYGSAGA